MSNLAKALALAARDIDIFPAAGKRPLVRWKDEASSTLAVVKGWWKRWPDANVGLPVPAGFVVVDIDDLAAVRGADLPFPLTKGQATPSGGMHLFYRAADGEPPQVVGRGGIALDTRVGGKGYIIAYADDPEVFNTDHWADAPGWVYDEAERPRPSGDEAPLGTHDAIASWLGRMVNANGQMSEEMAFALLKAKYATGGIVSLDPNDPWTDKEFRAFARSAAEWHPAEDLKLIVPTAGQKPDDRPLVDPAGVPTGFTRITDYRASVPDAVPWIAEPFIYEGGVTLLSGPAKAGKSTLAAQLQRARETGGGFLGKPVRRGPTLLVTEEGGIAVVAKTEGLTDLWLYDRKAAAGEDFDKTIHKIALWADDNPGGLVFIDTLAVWAGIDDENDASKATRAISKVMALAQENLLPVVLIHHTRKGGGHFGEAIRGSGAILATVDLSIELSREDEDSDNRRLDIQGRVVFPDRLSLRFDRETLTYYLGDALAEAREELAWLPNFPPGVPTADLEARGVTRRRRETLLKQGVLWENKRGRGSESTWYRNDGQGGTHLTVPEAGRDPQDP